MLESLKGALRAQVAELKKDATFFGTTGVFIGFFANAFAQAETIGIKLNGAALGKLLTDFMPTRAVLVIFMMLTLLCAIRNIAIASSLPATRLERVSRHSADRLRQLASSATCVAFGFAIGLGMTVLATFDGEAAYFAALVAFLGLILSFFAVAGTALERKMPPTQEPRTSAAIAFVAFGYLVYIAFTGFA